VNFYNREETQFHLKACIAIKNHLWKKHNILAHREWYVILDNEDRIVGLPRYEITEAQKARKEKYRNPDLLWWNNGLWILEVDGYVHHIKSAKTKTRNEIYENNNIVFLIVETFEMGKTQIKNKSIENIIQEVDTLIGQH